MWRIHNLLPDKHRETATEDCQHSKDSFFLGFLFYVFFSSDKTDSVEIFISVSKSNSVWKSHGIEW